jgi:hypothetical protein
LEAPLYEDSNHFVAAPSAWVSLAKVPDEVEKRFGVPAAKAAEILRPLLEESDISTIVVGWNGGRDQEDWVHRVFSSGPYPYSVSRVGFEYLDWTKGTLACHEVRVRWADVVRVHWADVASMTTPRSTSARPKAAATLGANAEAARMWMKGYFRGCSDAGNKPKRQQTIELCMSETRATWKEAEAAWKEQPVYMRNPPRTPKR